MGEMALGLQAKLLRVLQEREFERVGGTQAHSLDIRVVAATNRDLGEEVAAGKFREDLFHRLNVVNLESPALRERKEDIPVLAQFFLQRSAERCKRVVRGLSRDAEEMVMAYNWPGNVRELENAIESAVVMGLTDWVLPEDLPEVLLEAAPKEAGGKYHHSVGKRSPKRFWMPMRTVTSITSRQPGCWACIQITCFGWFGIWVCGTRSTKGKIRAKVRAAMAQAAIADLMPRCKAATPPVSNSKRASIKPAASIMSRSATAVGNLPTDAGRYV